MRKYVQCALVIFKGEFAYRFNTVLNMLFTVSNILLAYILWSAVYNGRTTVAGFSFDAMLTYYVISSFLSQLDMSSGSGGEIAARIHSGTFSGRMVMPINIFGFYAAQTVGAAVFHLSFNFVAAAVWVFLFKIPFALTSEAAMIFGAVTMVLLGLWFMQQLNYLVGIMAFKFQEVWMFNMIKNGLIHFATGSMIPLALLPAGVLAAMRFLPFYYITYLPTMLLMGRNAKEMLTGIGMLAIWNAAFAAINHFTYEHLRRLYDGVGI